MILVDSSVWIDFFNGRSTSKVRQLLSLLGNDDLLTGDLILAEVLQGFRSDQAFRKANELLSSLSYQEMAGKTVVTESVRNFRALRRKGITVRSTIDSLIAAFCIVHGHSLLHQDRDFDPFVRHCGLRIADV